MEKNEYLKLVLQDKDILGDKSWYVKAFTIPLWKDDKPEKLTKHELVIMTEGLHTVVEGEEGELVLTRIVDHDKNEPLFDWQDTLTVDSSWLPNIFNKMETKVGRLIVNKVILSDVLGDRIPFINKKMSPKDIENALVSKVKNKEDLRPGDITVREMVQCIDNLNFFVFVSSFSAPAATPKTITPPPGAKEFRNSLLKEFEGRLDDPVVISTIQDRINEYEKEYLKDDPVAAALFGGKARASRTKMYYFGGAGLDFVEGGNTTIANSLSEGMDTNPEEFSKAMNDLRYASYSRGGKTALGGYAYKTLQRALSGISIKPTPCNTTKGLVRVLNEKRVITLVGRYIKVGTKWVLIEDREQALKYANKPIEVRSPMYCLVKGNDVCWACMSEQYKDLESGVTNIAANISAVILTSNLKLMHNSAVGNVDIDLVDLIT